MAGSRLFIWKKMSELPDKRLELKKPASLPTLANLYLVNSVETIKYLYFTPLPMQEHSVSETNPFY